MLALMRWHLGALAAWIKDLVPDDLFDVELEDLD